MEQDERSADETQDINAGPSTPVNEPPTAGEPAQASDQGDGATQEPKAEEDTPTPA